MTVEDDRLGHSDCLEAMQECMEHFSDLCEHASVVPLPAASAAWLAPRGARATGLTYFVKK